MAYSREDNKKKSYISSNVFRDMDEDIIIPKYKLSKDPVDARKAYEILRDELLDEGNSRLNLATFCQTGMEEEAKNIIKDTLDKNAIDKSEYPRTAEMEKRCVSIIADLWNAPKEESYIGTSTIGSSEACMLAGLAMKFRWREWAKSKNISAYERKPNIIISSGFQVCWEKFATYWDIELRVIPMEENYLALNPERLKESLDDYTIGVVAILGITYTGKYDNVQEIDRVIGVYNREHNTQIAIHVDGASGGFYAPFISPELVWDFRLKSVISINASGHKYGLVYPGIGWLVFRDSHYLPKELVFNVSYLGGDVPTMSINFSKSASQLIGQYYNFVRLGFNGYYNIHKRTKAVAKYISDFIESVKIFDLVCAGEDLPVICYSLKKEIQVDWTLYELSDSLLMHGWQVPTYPLPIDMEDKIVQRIVCRSDLSMDLGEIFVEDMKQSIQDLNESEIIVKRKREGVRGFTH
ncbi:MAG: glutamate decarboxylase [Lachnospiraceae bacterium]|nr:glutamate decarboxylase [Lachnospiraceae bacterium]